MRRFKSPGQAQRFLTVHGLIQNLFRVGRHLGVPGVTQDRMSLERTGLARQRQFDITLETIQKVGRRGWQRESGYRQQGAVENLFFRFKRTLGNSLRARGYESQEREAMIGCNVLNRMFELGKPECQAILAE